MPPHAADLDLLTAARGSQSFRVSAWWADQFRPLEDGSISVHAHLAVEVARLDRYLPAEIAHEIQLQKEYLLITIFSRR
jgi:hypothetical protein